MKSTARLLFAAALLAAPAFALAATDATAAKPASADLAALKIVPVADAIKAAVAANPGPVAKVTLEAKAGAAVYAVEIPGANNAVTTVQVDAISGRVTGSSTEFGAKKSGEAGAKGGEAGTKGKPRGKEDDDD